jgi:hypothetical protein
MARWSIALGWLLIGGSIAVACGGADEKRSARDGAVGGETSQSTGSGGAPSLPTQQANAGEGGQIEHGTGGAGGTVAGSASELGGGGGGLGGSGCEAPVTKLPDLTGKWLICNALDTNGRIWTGVLTLESETRTCEGATVAGNFHWVTTNLGAATGDTLCAGTYDAVTKKLTLDEYKVTGGTVATGIDTMFYDAGSDTMTNGGWTCSCAPGMWNAATRLATNANATCQ